MVTQEKLTCKAVQVGQTYKGKQALTYYAGVSAESTGSQGICMHLLTLPPGKRGKAHLHEEHETAIYVIQGEAAMWYGDKLDQHMVVRAGDFLYIPPNMPHLPYNPSATESCTCVISRTDPNEQESVVLLPELEGLR